jgi:hypothetical protein
VLAAEPALVLRDCATPAEGEALMLYSLRSFAFAGLLALSIFVAVEYAVTAGVLPPFTSPASQFLRDAFITTGFALTFTAGVVAGVVCLPRRQYRWAVVLVVLLVLATYRPFIAALILNGAARFHLGSPPALALLLDPYVAQNLPTFLLALLVLIYSFQRPRAVASAAATPNSTSAATAASISRHAQKP